MSEASKPMPLAPSRFERAWNQVVSWWRGPQGQANVDWAEVRAKAPAPVFWLLGKTQSGKTSLIRYLTGAEEAEIGSGFRPCTKHSRKFPFPGEDAPVITFLDTRGLDEPGYNPTEDLAAFDTDAHLLVVTCRITDFATGQMIRNLKTIRESKSRRPVLLVLTCLHDAYPQQQHPQPYPPSVNARFPEAVETLLAEQKEVFGDFVDRMVLVDLTKPVEGYDDPNYGGDMLKQQLLALLPQAYRETLRHLVDTQAQFRDRQQKRAAPVLVGYSTLATTAGAFPIPFVDLLILPTIQARMIQELAARSGNRETATRFLELSASAGIGLMATVALRQVAKFIPYVGSVVGAGLAGASTYALGLAFLEYDRRVHDGHLPDKDEVAKLYKQHLSSAEQSWKSKA